MVNIPLLMYKGNLLQQQKYHVGVFLPPAQRSCRILGVFTRRHQPLGILPQTFLHSSYETRRFAIECSLQSFTLWSYCLFQSLQTEKILQRAGRKEYLHIRGDIPTQKLEQSGQQENTQA